MLLPLLLTEASWWAGRDPGIFFSWDGSFLNHCQALAWSRGKMARPEAGWGHVLDVNGETKWAGG